MSCSNLDNMYLYIMDITDVKDYKAYYEGPNKGLHQYIHILDLYEI